MSTVQTQGESRVVLYDVSWATFEALVNETRRGGTRFTYNRGCLEIMSPSRDHEQIKTLFGRMIETMTYDLGIPISSAGSTTLKDELLEKGVEPDECYYVANEPRIRHKKGLDLSVDPPPDLAIEVDLTSSSLDQLAIYSSLGVHEVWLYNGSATRVFALTPDGTYAQQARSAAFPFLPIEELHRFLSLRNAMEENRLIREFIAWVRTLDRDTR